MASTSSCSGPDGCPKKKKPKCKKCGKKVAANANGTCPVDASGSPIQYWDGAAELSQSDLSIAGGGFFSMSREYSNQMSSDVNGPVGWNWVLPQMPSVARSGDSVAVFFDPNDPYWFRKAGDGYEPLYSTVGVTLKRQAGGKLAFVASAGTGQDTTVFDAATGLFVSNTDARGIVTTIAAQTAGRIDELQRSFTIAGVTTTQSLLYTYYGPGTAGEGRIQFVTFRQQVGAGSWTDLQRAAYAYYGGGGSDGSQGDLKTATRQRPDGSGGWEDTGVRYYRYYQTGDPKGFAHGLKLHFGPEAYRRMFNDGINLNAASDATIKPYADHYFEYDPGTRAVTLEVSAVCDSCPGGGTTSDTFVYTQNPRNPPKHYDLWSMKTTQTLPDNSQIVVYTNYVGQTLLYVHKNAGGTQEWCTFYRPDGQGRVVWVAEPSAVSGYDDSYDDLLNYNTTTNLYQYLKNTDGLIRVTDYYGAASPAAGYVKSESVRKGQQGADVLVRSYTYTSNTAGGHTVQLLATASEHPDETNPAAVNTTSYAYTWYTGSNQLKQKTTTLPVVPTGQNGSGVAATTVENYNRQGNVNERTDERGVVSKYQYDPIFGRLTKQTLNVQSGVTAAGVNVVTEFEYDEEGRLVQTLGPAHTTVVGGVATTVRPATWNVNVASAKPVSGNWGLDENRSGSGYATGTAPSYTYTLVNPVSIDRSDKNGRSVDRISAKRTTGSGKLSATDTFARGDWTAWSSTQVNRRGQTVSGRVYHSIPASGEGVVGTNYGQSDYAYDDLERRVRATSPGGTITRTVWTAPQRVASTWVGTDDTGATDANPAGSGAPNNMVKVAENQYDGGSDGGDGNLTQVTAYASASDTRVTAYSYDWRNRRTSADGEVDYYQAYEYDNLDRLTRTDQKNTSSAGNLIGRTESKYDRRGRVYRTLTYAVNPSTGAVGNHLTGDNWFDAAGNVIQQVGPGGGETFTKTVYNGVGWVTASYTGYNTGGTSYSQAGTVAGDTILSQSQSTYDEAGNVLSTAGYERLNDAPATGTGSTGALSQGTNPKARVSYSATWYDGADRPIASAAYGAVTSFTRPGTPPASTDTVLVSTAEYGGAGRVFKTVDPRGIESRTGYDDAGRVTQTIEAYSASTADDRNRTTNYTYTLDNQVATMTAVNGRTGDQTTTYTYGTTLSDSGVARNDLLRTTTYPDYTVGNNDRTTNSYNRLGERTTFTDQRGTVHSYDYDKLGRPLHDRVTTPGSGTDTAVLRISGAYDVRGMVQTLTSYDNATIGSGTVLNQVKVAYNNFGQLQKEEQAHGGSVVGSTPDVRYDYANGGQNQLRPETLTYPSGRTISYDYGTNGGMDDRLSRVGAIKDGTTSLAAYTYLGSGTVIRIDYSQPQVRLDLWGGVSGTFNGFDRFGRVVDQRWLNTGTSTDLDRYGYGYDRDSSRVWKQNQVGTALDEYYTYDQLNRLSAMDRGTLTGSPPSGIGATPVKEQDWTLDPTGNWRGYLTKTSGATDLDQSRTSSTVNAITAITETTGPSWIDPLYDSSGNTTTFPKPTPTSGFTATYDAWNRLKEVKDGSNTVTKYAYDGRNRRIVLESYTSGSLTETRHVYYTSNWQAVEERVGASTTPDVQHVWGIRYVDELVCRDDATPARIYALQDANFNVTALVNTSGSVVQRFVYDPYGPDSVRAANWSTTTDAYAWRYRFQGGRLDPLNNLYAFRNRDYHTLLGRWVQRDPKEDGDTALLYEYLYSEPQSYTDPDGLEGQELYARRQKLTKGKCGQALLLIQWKLKDEPLESGWIVQEVKIKVSTEWCTKSDKKLPEKCNADKHYWEAWPVSKTKSKNPKKGTAAKPIGAVGGFYHWSGKAKRYVPGSGGVNTSVGDTDQFSHTSCGICTKGTATYEGDARYYPNLDLPTGFKPHGEPWAGALLSTQDQPKLDAAGATASAKHDLKFNWNCCPDNLNDTVITSPTETK